MKKKIVLVDIDHTIANSYWRDSMIGGQGGWDAYYTAGDRDEPFLDVVEVLNSLHDGGWPVFALTGRPEKWRPQTMTWMIRHGVKLDGLLMRPNNNHTPSPIVKIALVEKHFKKEDVLVVFDDRDDVCAAFRAIGIRAFQVINS